MPFNGSGTFSRSNGVNSGSTTWQTDRDAGTLILAGRHDTHDEDIATGLTTAICKDGQTTVTANLPMGGYKHTNVGNASARTQYATAGQIQDGSVLWAGTASGTTTITASVSPAITAYVTGMRLAFLMGASPSGASPTLNVNSVGAASLVDPRTGAALPASYLAASRVVEVIYNGTGFTVLSPSATHVGALSVTGAFSGLSATIGTGETAAGPAQITISPTGHATSERAEIAIDQWRFFQDNLQNGTKDFALYSNVASRAVIVCDTSGNVTTLGRGWESWAPIYGGTGTMTYSGVTTEVAAYLRVGSIVFLRLRASGTTGGTASTGITFTLPISAVSGDYFEIGAASIFDSTDDTGLVRVLNTDITRGVVYKRAISNYGLGATRVIAFFGAYRVA